MPAAVSGQTRIFQSNILVIFELRCSLLIFRLKLKLKASCLLMMMMLLLLLLLLMLMLQLLLRQLLLDQRSI